MKVVVIGSGEMGHGIAEVMAIYKNEVTLVDIKDEILDKAISKIRESLDRLKKRGSIEEEPEDILKRITKSINLEEAVKDADLVIEAVPEIVDLKQNIFKRLDQFTKPDAILATNTSNIRISEISKFVNKKDRVVGMHFFNPPVLMQLVEIIKGPDTSPEVVQKLYEITKQIGKTPVIVNKDTPGFIVNRINAAESLFICLVLQKGINYEEVDAYFRSLGLPMGPYELMDYVGLDIVAHSLEYFAKEISPEYGKCTKIKEMVNNGLLGRKSGRGFYDWTKGRPQINAKQNPIIDVNDLLAIDINEASKLLEDNVATPNDIETAVKLGMNRPFGPITVAKSADLNDVKSRLERISSEYGITIFQPTDSIKTGKLKELLEGEKKEEKKEFETLNVSKEGKVAIVKLNRPKLNLINYTLLDELDRLLTELWNDRSINVILITGEGQNFSGGAELSAPITDQVQFLELVRKGERTFKRLTEIPKIVIAFVKGYALGGGFELSSYCDLRIATENAVFGFPETGLGLVPAWGGTQRLPKLIGISRAMYLILTAQRISAKEALEYGLVNKIVKDENEALEFAKDLSERIAPISAMLAKRLINRGSEVPIDVGLEMESIAGGLLFTTEDLKEGIVAFFSKRKPEFKGK
ncbi:3-hydroxyacyl-CoA dehydrogenase/enoyl-CoA hydratase family protein [Sulfolobus acidocaldarius]|uniref:Conserved 3-hydroxybutyryl-CoA n=4 Tax=Sulfolobus acidocaldarius TaxID=2285 RepID=Q4J6S7_SULAC|nr:3-hydroxyacyl-CoA dehydrogenase/enoyl-CoA hydratase family protein [Sulfolobus acidocaldarius]AAY81504.1 conserved 3-hydroxybutyryl-CoA [Sulfolobus acidocaldarius DSM 639]AGE72109.1 3-hydroxybutyryl-CoA [Sulfolobus acidocaldarius N8]AGE74426.1 3-hydroxybutyryl-CoA [Sulfolobus acidocaldarius Ron12/I]ALU29714.1 3-hydroxyacyl-CoA dehydrogenase [Sulfolobus acidocaldarius]ALU32451.1 3-hydroxyacyl-CoA dehydrogenase [Sulfolobus acidocaldarius]